MRVCSFALLLLPVLVLSLPLLDPSIQLSDIEDLFMTEHRRKRNRIPEDIFRRGNSEEKEPISPEGLLYKSQSSLF